MAVGFFHLPQSRTVIGTCSFRIDWMTRSLDRARGCFEIGSERVPQVREACAQAAQTNVARSILLFVLHDQQGGWRRSAFSRHATGKRNPCPLCGRRRQGNRRLKSLSKEPIATASGQEELVGGVVDFLSAEVPDVCLQIALQDPLFTMPHARGPRWGICNVSRSRNL
jgi:hypothetical protein